MKVCTRHWQVALYKRSLRSYPRDSFQLQPTPILPKASTTEVRKGYPDDIDIIGRRRVQHPHFVEIERDAEIIGLKVNPDKREETR